jgi:CheY-like chemotaxis protein
MPPLARVRALPLPGCGLLTWAALAGVAALVVFMGWSDGSGDKTLPALLGRLGAQALAAGGLVLVAAGIARLRRPQGQPQDPGEPTRQPAHDDPVQTPAHQDAQLATLGHELRTPMNAILGLNGVLRQALHDHPEQVQWVAHMRLATAQALQRVNEVLDQAQRQAQTAATAPLPEDTLSQDAALRILVVDDNATNRMVARVQLQTCWPGADIVAVDSGAQALAVLAAQGFDLALIDMHMPGMDGPELARRIRLQWPALTTRMPLVALTANTHLADRQRCLDAGMDDVLDKPIDLTVLVRCVSRHVLRARG